MAIEVYLQRAIRTEKLHALEILEKIDFLLTKAKCTFLLKTPITLAAEW
jgi:hypothetical protein